ncbi:PREDICTED: origin recognition complex subunit 1 [Cyprinodon variegatus]|uniref:Origin recognition complex subunit 1 n=1 Tax=Cyprinodon variegatus TaxID=28743 RepID=A0A3Q2CXA8_CYPVA|nr:PREDICTED: origin recognition complex subunit 1 [Cyprinodon variegatus]
MKYLTRLRVRRTYEWRGEAVGFNRKLKTLEFRSLAIGGEGVPQTAVSSGQHILIEGEDHDNPFVARVERLFEDESGRQKKATVQWFVRVSEVPPSKLKLLGREPHPQEIFFYDGRSCDDEVDVESILRPVEVRHLDADAPFPAPEDGGPLYVKFCWDSRTFRPLDPSLFESAPPRPPQPSLPLGAPGPAHAATPTSRGPGRRALPTPDPAVLRRAASGDVHLSRTAASAGKPAESAHSLTKLSVSKSLSARRTGTQLGVRKKLQLCDAAPTGSQDGPNVPSGAEPMVALTDDVLDQLLESTGSLARRLASPPRTASLAHSLTPLRRTDGGRGPGSSSRTSTSRAQEASQDSPTDPVGAAPRSSKRRSALKVSSRIRQQLNLLDVREDLSSDPDEEDEFVPSKKELQSSEEEEEEEDDEGVVVKKNRSSSSAGSGSPSSKRNRSSARTPRKTPRKVGPRTPRHATPSIPNRAQPTRRPANVLEEARTRLHVSSVPESLPCREQEFQDIYSFVESKILDGTGGCMYISGVPGTGKTATVHEVMRCLQHAAAADEIPAFLFVEINGMKMTDPHQAYVQILQKLTGQKATADHAAALLEKRFSSPALRKETTVLLVDELDLLWTRKQNVMYNLFDWPTRRHARLVVLTIANTMDLPERIMINRVASRLGLTRMSFQPYTFKQLQQIITSRLNKVKAFEEDALQLVSRKVAALSGDARRCLDICRRATEICEHSAADPSAAGLVGMVHVMEALNEMFSSAYITAIKCASTQEQLFLRAVIAEFRRLGLEEATFQQVLVQHQALCRVEGLQPVSVSEGLAVCRRLGACRLLLLEPSRLGVLQRIRLNVSQDDVLFALKAD